jgi:8-oxo-dGTP diphosphatase
MLYALCTVILAPGSYVLASKIWNVLMKRPRVGVGVFVKKEGKILVGKRKGSHGAATWALPGGHLEPGESFEACCKREVHEETGLIIKNISSVVFTNDVFHDEGLHYITLFFKGEYESGEATVAEPQECEEWRWVSLNHIPQPIFLPLRNALEEINERDLSV